MIFALQPRRRALALPLLVFTLALAGCGSSAAEAATAPVSQPAAQPAAQSAAQTKSSAVAPAVQPAAPVAASPTAAPLAQKALVASAVTGIPTRLVLPSIKLDTGVTELGWSTSKNKAGQVFSEWDVAAYAAGWHKNSGKPNMGGNVVLSAHNNILGAVFRELDQLKRGDTAVLYVGDKAFTYSIDKVMIVPERDASPEQQLENGQWIQPTGDERLTLVSCWPRDDNSHRIIVVAHPVVSN